MNWEHILILSDPSDLLTVSASLIYAGDKLSSTISMIDGLLSGS